MGFTARRSGTESARPTARASGGMTTDKLPEGNEISPAPFALLSREAFSPKHAATALESAYLWFPLYTSSSLREEARKREEGREKHQ